MTTNIFKRVSSHQPFILALLSKVSPTLLSIITLPIIYRIVNIGNVGKYEELLFLSSVVVLILKFSIPSLIFRQKFKSRKSSISLIYAFEVIAAFGYFTLFFTLLSLKQDPLVIALLTSTLGLVCVELINRDIQFRENYMLGFSIFFSMGLFLQLLKIVLVLLLSDKFLALVLSETITNLFYIFIYIGYRRNFLSRKFRFKNPCKALIKHKKYWLQLYLHHIISFANQYMNKLLVIVFLAASDMALLSLAIKILLPASLLFDVINYYLVPKLFRREINYKKLIFTISPFVFLFSIIYYFIARTLILALFPPDFSSSVEIMTILLIALNFNFLYRLSTSKHFKSENLTIILLISMVNFAFISFLVYFQILTWSVHNVALLSLIVAITQFSVIICSERFLRTTFDA